MRTGLVATVLVAVVLAACGDGSRLTRGQFARDASRICSRASDRVARTAVPRLSRHRAAASALARLAERERSVLGHLRDLREPKVESDGVDAWLAAADQLVDEIDFAVEAVRHSDVRTAEAALDRADALERRVLELGRRHGVSPCRFAPSPRAS